MATTFRTRSISGIYLTSHLPQSSSRSPSCEGIVIRDEDPHFQDGNIRRHLRGVSRIQTRSLRNHRRWCIRWPALFCYVLADSSLARNIAISLICVTVAALAWLLNYPDWLILWSNYVAILTLALGVDFATEQLSVYFKGTTAIVINLFFGETVPLIVSRMSVFMEPILTKV